MGDVDMASRAVVAASTASLFLMVALFALLSNQEHGHLFPSGAPQSALVSRGAEVLEPSVKNGLIVPSLAKVESATKLLYSIPKSSDCRKMLPLYHSVVGSYARTKKAKVPLETIMKAGELDWANKGCAKYGTFKEYYDSGMYQQ